MKDTKNNELEKTILSVICYFDIFDYPLTLLEIFKWLNIDNSNSISLSEIKSYLDNSECLNSKVDFKDGHYFLSGRKEIIPIRIKRYNLAEYKFKKALRIIKILSHFPYLKAIAVYSSLSYSNSAKSGDIDLFIITAKGKIWTTRFFVNLFLKTFNLRPTKDTCQDKICVSFFVTEDSLGLLSVNDKLDVLYTYGTGQFLFVYDSDNFRSKFFSENSWLRQQMPNWQPSSLSLRRRFYKKPTLLKRLFQFIFGRLPESWYKKIQHKILPDKIKTLMNQDTKVVISDKMIKLHDNDKRKEFGAKFNDKYNQLIQ
jgi:hypothetical protein